MDSSSAEAGSPQPRCLHCLAAGWLTAGAGAGCAGGTGCDEVDRPLDFPLKQPLPLPVPLSFLEMQKRRPG
eukprot:49780-Amphidinium_carterae.1